MNSQQTQNTLTNEKRKKVALPISEMSKLKKHLVTKTRS